MKANSSSSLSAIVGVASLLLAGALGQPSRAAAQAAPVALSPVEQLTSPIALYPDPLIALILPASAVPDDLVAAAEYLNQSGDPTQIDNQPWDPSVRGLAHYPGVLEWMAQNLNWTKALGAAFASDPNSVLGSIQQLRGVAKAAGTLSTTPQQAVVQDGADISIEPADPEMLYVPSYDPDVVFVGAPYFGYDGPFLTFGIGYSVGFWLSYGLDWHHHAIWFGDWRNWHTQQGWGHPVFPGQRGFINASAAHRWLAPRALAQARFSPAHMGVVARPRSFPGLPPPPSPRAAGQPPRIGVRVVPTPATPAPRVGQWQQGRAPAAPNGANARESGTRSGMTTREAYPADRGETRAPSNVHPSYGPERARALPAPAKKAPAGPEQKKNPN